MWTDDKNQGKGDNGKTKIKESSTEHSHCVHGERLRWPSTGLRHCSTRMARRLASSVRATVWAMSKGKLQPSQAPLTVTPSAANKIKQLLKDKPEHVSKTNQMNSQ